MTGKELQTGCPKRMVNGPCGGVRDGLCEVDGRQCPYIQADTKHIENPIIGPGMIKKGLPPNPAEKPRILRQLEDGNKLLFLELEPSRRGTGRRLLEQAGYFKRIVDGYTITDNPLGRVQADPLAALALLRMNNFEEIIVTHISSKDRNRAALTSLAIGSLWLRVDGFLALTGDWPGFMAGKTKPVFDLDSVRLVYMLRLLRDHGLDYMGGKIKEVPTFSVAVAFNSHATPISHEIARLVAKKRAGAEIVFTQPVLHPSDLEKVKEARSIVLGKAGMLYFIPTVMVVRTPSEALMLHEKARIKIPSSLIEGLQRKGIEYSMQYTVKQVEEILSKPWVSGVMIATHGDLEVNKRLAKMVKDMF
ncbi:MAG: methylenetetrahydrofolate reductase C-terminal domain-containing protein [Desulfurococcales archaeon]|nr:methylenetetrahydrofolate reductase C-terminal domain-containing protein [Desulfurococcales archaeon]